MKKKKSVRAAVLPGDPALKAIKLRAHELSAQYSLLAEHDAVKSDEIIGELLAAHGANTFIQGPVFFHYGIHTSVGDNFFC